MTEGGLAPGVLCDNDYVAEDVVQEGSQRCTRLCGNIG